jgi:hypothetical protein
MGSKPLTPIQIRLWQRNLKVLADFCENQKSDPDAIIAAAANRECKNNFMRALKNWIKTYESAEERRHDAENTVRLFFITNGLRVITKPYSDVYNRPRSPRVR